MDQKIRAAEELVIINIFSEIIAGDKPDMRKPGKLLCFLNRRAGGNYIIISVINKPLNYMAADKTC